MIKKEYLITEENRYSVCDEVSAEIAQFCKQYYNDRRDIQRYRLSAEECMLEWLTEESVGHTLTLILSPSKLLTPYFKLLFDGKSVNPYLTKSSAGSFSDTTLRALGLVPSYKYIGSVNTIQFNLTAQNGRKSLFGFGIIIIFAVLIGYFGKLLIPQNVMSALVDTLLDPVYELFLDLLSLVAGPMIFLSVSCGIYGIGDTLSLSKIGKNIIFIFLMNTLIVCLLGLAFIPFFGLVFSGEAAGVSQYAEIVDMIFGCVPSNLVDPFSTGNTLQIVFLAVIIGISLLYLGKKTSSVAKAIEEVNILIQHMMSFITKLIPGLVFVIIILLFWNGTFHIVLSSWKFCIALLCGCLLTCLLFLITMSIRFGISPVKILKKIMPSVLIAILTASSAATFETTVKICTNKLGIDKSVTGFSVPLGMVMHNPIAALNNLLLVFFFAEIYGVECSPVWFATAVFISTMLAIASPPIPGGGIIVYTMLFTQFGIPIEAVAIASTIDMLTDFIITSSEIFCLFPGFSYAADKVGKLDRKVLCK